jgi:hypothetical protein
MAPFLAEEKRRQRFRYTRKKRPGANPTIASYNASAVNFYNATGSLARFETKIMFFFFEKRSSLLQRWRCSSKFNSRRIASQSNNRELQRQRSKKFQRHE